MTRLAQCRATAPDGNYVEHDYLWRTLDGADPQGDYDGAPNDGCQRIGYDYPDYGEPNYLALPAGWVLAPNDATSIAVVAAHGWSTFCAVLADGTAWGSTNAGAYGHGYTAGGSCNSDRLATSGGTYTVTSCHQRVLARCG